MRKHRAVPAVQPMKRLDRQRDLNAARNVQKCARPDLRLVERCELLSAKDRLLTHEMLAKQVRMSVRRLLDWQPNDTSSRHLIGKNSISQNPSIPKSHAAGNRIKAA